MTCSVLYPGGGLRKPGDNELDTEVVKVTTVDAFISARLTPGEHLDLLKIDTEGNDNRVLEGARTALATQLGVFALEGGQGVTFSKEMINNLDNQGYSCYSSSRAGLFKVSRF